jgi:hypothetical protein
LAGSAWPARELAAMTERAGSGAACRGLTRAALALFPRAWRDRYGPEIAALLADSGRPATDLASLAWRAPAAWIWPPPQLHDREARMRASVGTVLAAWAALTALGIVFAQLTQLQGFSAPGHPLVSWSYLVFDTGLAVSVLVAVAGGVPLWLQMMGQARRERRRRERAWLSAAVAGPALFLAVSALALRIVHHPEGAGPRWFVAFAVLGFVTAGIACAGPIVALHRLRPRGPAVDLATTAATIALSGIATGLAATGLCRWDRAFAGYHHAGLLGGYLLLVLMISATATVSAGRGIRARLARPAA